VPTPPPPKVATRTSQESREVTITLTTEHDIPRARQIVREICETLGTRPLTQQRLVTIVSELGRNMVLYAGGGKLTLRPPVTSSRRVVIFAVDQGPGIPNLPEILAGKYKSRTGLGLGIVGTKRLADTFHIETGRHGTAISVEVIV
jgi:serine/threonine-protein kinase RsbT